LDVVLARKLRARGQPEAAIGALSEMGGMYLDPRAEEILAVSREYLEAERDRQLAEIARRKELFRGIRQRAAIVDRSVIVAEDGIATGSTMIAALQVVRMQRPYELIVAVPMAPKDRLEEVGRWCDEIYCLTTPEDFLAIGRYYHDFSQIEDDQVIGLL